MDQEGTDGPESPVVGESAPDPGHADAAVTEPAHEPPTEIQPDAARDPTSDATGEAENAFLPAASPAGGAIQSWSAEEKAFQEKQLRIFAEGDKALVLYPSILKPA